jgi:hypothetical protein
MTGLNTMLGRPPTGADLLAGIHQFDLFEQELPNTAGMRGNDAARILPTRCPVPLRSEMTRSRC